MSADTYTVKVESLTVAQHMALDVAMILVEAMFSHWFNATNMAITIEREDNRPSEVVKTESDKMR